MAHTVNGAEPAADQYFSVILNRDGINGQTVIMWRNLRVEREIKGPISIEASQACAACPIDISKRAADNDLVVPLHREGNHITIKGLWVAVFKFVVERTIIIQPRQ